MVCRWPLKYALIKKTERGMAMKRSILFFQLVLLPSYQTRRALQKQVQIQKEWVSFLSSVQLPPTGTHTLVWSGGSSQEPDTPGL